jgi:hypothetical protein
MSVYEDYTYEEYLEVWRQHFGDAETGEYGYYPGSEHIPCNITRLSPEEFEKYVKRAVEADEAFYRAMRADDDAGMEAALTASFPVELALLV